MEAGARSYYHLCPARLGLGSIIEPGHFGHLVGAYGYKHNHFARESVLERSRMMFAPEVPSRLACVFAFLSQGDAAAFKFREHAGGFGTSYLYEVIAVDPHAPACAVPIDVLERWNFDDAENLASTYWSGRYAPTGDGPVAMGGGVTEIPHFYEVLLASSVRVVRRIG